MFPSSYHYELLPMTEVMSMQKVKGRSQRSRSQRSQTNLAVSGLQLQFEFTYDDGMMLKSWCCFEEVPLCFSGSSITFQGHTGQNIAGFDTNWAFPDCDFTLNLPMALKCWNFKVARAEKSTIESDLSKITRPVTAIKYLRLPCSYFDSLTDI